MNPNAGISPLREDQIGPVSQLLSAAFFDSPSYIAVFPNPAIRKSGLKLFFQTALKLHLKREETWVMAEGNEILGTFTLESPGKEEIPVWEILFSGGWKVPFQFGPRTVSRMRHAQKIYQAIPERLGIGPHFYLGMVAVDPRLQGQGTGTRMMQFARNLWEQPREGKRYPVLLFTQEEPNVKWYERMGFIVKETIQIPEHAGAPAYTNHTLVLSTPG